MAFTVKSGGIRSDTKNPPSIDGEGGALDVNLYVVSTYVNSL